MVCRSLSSLGCARRPRGCRSPGIACERAFESPVRRAVAPRKTSAGSSTLAQDRKVAAAVVATWRVVGATTRVDPRQSSSYPGHWRRGQNDWQQYKRPIQSFVSPDPYDLGASTVIRQCKFLNSILVAIARNLPTQSLRMHASQPETAGRGPSCPRRGRVRQGDGSALCCSNTGWATIDPHDRSGMPHEA